MRGTSRRRRSGSNCWPPRRRMAGSRRREVVAMKVLHIEPEKCTGCLRCEVACSYTQTGEFLPAKSVIHVSSFESHTSYSPYTCFQCEEGWCMTACPVEAITISPAGAKIVVE